MFGFGPGRIRTLVYMATDNSHRQWENIYKSSSLKPQDQELSYFLCSNV